MARAIRAWQVGQARLPQGGSLGKPVGIHPLQRQEVMQHVGLFRQLILRGSDDQIEMLQARPGPPQMDQAHAPARLLTNPASHGFIAPSGGDHQIRPGQYQGTGFTPDDPGQGTAQQDIAQQLSLAIC